MPNVDALIRGWRLTAISFERPAVRGLNIRSCFLKLEVTECGADSK